MPSVTFFGATGGCGLAALTRTLKSGISATAPTISEHLTIVEGNVCDLEPVKKALLVRGSGIGAEKRICDLIVSGIGGTPQLSRPVSITRPITLDNPTICLSATEKIIEGLQELQREGVVGKPIIAVVSTTGISDDYRDVPLAFVPLYHWGLAVPHEDKRNMEALLKETVAHTETSPIKGFIAIKPSLLVDGDGVGADKLRVGWERGEPEGHGPAIGYTVTRNDVGDWIFQEIVKNEERDKWVGRLVSLTA